MPQHHDTSAAAIYRRSFATIRAEAAPSRFDADGDPVAGHMSHAAGADDTGLAPRTLARLGCPDAPAL